MANDRLNIDQKRAQFAFKIADKKDKEFGSLTKKLPAYIQTNGLVYSLAFLNEKKKIKDGKKNSHYLLLDALHEWHCTSDDNSIKLSEFIGVSDSVKFLEKTVHLNNDEELRFLTLETLALLTWLRRFVKDDE